MKIDWIAVFNSFAGGLCFGGFMFSDSNNPWKYPMLIFSILNIVAVIYRTVIMK